MTDDELILGAKELLGSYRRLGLQQIELYKELNPDFIRRMTINGQELGEIDGVFVPMPEVVRRIMAQEDAYIVDILDGFWNYFLLNEKYLDSPARQGIDRTLMEYCYQRLIPLTNYTATEMRRTLLISQLCDLGMILAAPSEPDRPNIPGYTDDYNYFTSQLASDEDRVKFANLQSQDYPTHEFAKAKHALLPSFFKAFNDYSDDMVFPWADSSQEGVEKVRRSILRMYLHLHDFVHGSHTAALSAVEAMEDDKHVFASWSVTTQCGYQVLSTVNVKYLNNRTVDLTEIIENTRQLTPEIANRLSRMSFSN